MRHGTMLKTLAYLTALVTLAFGVTVAADGDGGYAGAFLQVPAGARPTAMGAYLAVSDDAAAPLFNPAGLVGLDRPMFGTSYRAMKLDRVLGYATFAYPTKGYSVLAVHWLYAGSGSVDARDSDGDKLGYDISQNNHQFTILFAKRFEKIFAAGANISYLHSTMPDFTAYSVGFDLGAMFFLDYLIDREKRDEFPISDMQAGVTVKNISKLYQWDNTDYNMAHNTSRGLNRVEEDRVPLEFGVGLSGRLLNKQLLLATDVIKNVEQGVVLRAGGEYSVVPEFALRAGYSDGRLTAGTGYLFKMGEHLLTIDYAFSTDKADEGSEHIFSFELRY